MRFHFFTILFSGCLLASAALAGEGLDAAYEKEFAFLEAEKRALAERLRAIKAERKKREARGNAEIATLQDGLLSGQEQIADLEESLEKGGTTEARHEEDFLRLQETLKRANERILKEGLKPIDVPELTADAASWSQALAQMLDATRELLKNSRTIRVKTESFFNPSGTELDGKVIFLGDVARYGLSDSVSGPLAPAGEGKWKIWESTDPVAIERLANSDSPTLSIPAFLFDSPNKNVERQAEKTPLMIVQAGGVIAWVIVGLGALALLLTILRVLLLGWATWGVRAMNNKVAGALEKGQFEHAKAMAHGNRLAVAPVIRTLIEHREEGREDLENRVGEVLLGQSPRLTRFGASMSVIAAASPLLGLLGTVTGMISTFDVITEHGTGDPRMLSGGISEALITTELGLIVAIPALIFGTLLGAWASRSQEGLEKEALRVINRLPDPQVAEATQEEAELNLHREAA